MLVSNLSEVLDIPIVAGEKKEKQQQEIKGVYIGDLLSIVMSHAKEGDMWLTVQGHINSVAVAVLNNLAAIVLVEGIKPDELMKQKADEEGIPILVTSKSSYEVATELIRLIK